MTGSHDSLLRFNHDVSRAARGLISPFAVLLLFIASSSFAQKAAILKVVLNTVDTGEFPLQMTDDGDILVPSDTLRALGIHIPGRTDTGAPSISLRALAPAVTFTFDAADASVLVSADPSFLGTQRRDFARTKRISPWYRSGGVVVFKTEKFMAITGRLFFVVKGEKIPAQYAGLDVTVDGEIISSVVGLGGVFYLENVPKGTHHARLYTTDKEAAFELVVPDSHQTVVDLGEIDCNVK